MQHLARLGRGVVTSALAATVGCSASASSRATTVPASTSIAAAITTGANPPTTLSADEEQAINHTRAFLLCSQFKPPGHPGATLGGSFPDTAGEIAANSNQPPSVHNMMAPLPRGLLVATCRYTDPTITATTICLDGSKQTYNPLLSYIVAEGGSHVEIPVHINC
jgi:hypothetical protein